MSSVFSGGLCSPSQEKKNVTTPRSNTDSILYNGTIAMEGVSEDYNMTNDKTQQQQGDNDHANNNASPTTTKGVCGQEMSCFEFEEFEKFGFNPFQQDSNAGCNDVINAVESNNTINSINNPISISLSPSINATDSQQKMSPSSTPNKKYEIRLKSTFSSMRVKKDNMLDKAIKLRQHQEQQQSQQVKKSVGDCTPSSPFHQSTAAEQPAERKKNSNDEELDNEKYHLGSISSRALPSGLPIRELTIPNEIEQSVSELTMRSHGAFDRYTSDSRRMAYYAVGRAAAVKSSNNNDGEGNDDNKNNSSLSGGGNRRCYFSGCIIAYDVPFYAGSVQQGPRTLVVFCLPSALDLPSLTTTPSSSSSSITKAERERYLESLPPPNANLLSEMRKQYREPFDTLPVQVRSPHCWRLFVKFCFFSGLPIAEGELHYCVKNSAATFLSSMQSPQQQQEEIALSHEVMEGELTVYWTRVGFPLDLFNSLHLPTIYLMLLSIHYVHIIH